MTACQILSSQKVLFVKLQCVIVLVKVFWSVFLGICRKMFLTLV